METEFKKADLFFGLCFLILVFKCDGFDYPNDTQLTLCQAQCEAVCLDHVVNCEQQCQGTRRWTANCDGPNCPSTCSVLFHHQVIQNLVPVPSLSISRLDNNHVELSWQRPASVNPNYTIIYIIERTRPDPNYQSIKSVALIGWVRDERYQVEEQQLNCSGGSYRIMAINQFGSLGFSNPVSFSGLIPGLVQNISFTGKGIYYYNDKDDPVASKFMAILKWEPPPGWKSADISGYEWNKGVRRYCTDMSHDSIPTFINMRNQTNRVLMTIAAHSFGCEFTAQVRAISQCHKIGPWQDFVLDLKNCSAINGYTCKPLEFNPPGPVQNVSLSISATPFSEMAIQYEFKYNVNPLLVNLHIHYLPPVDRGSQGIIKEYIIRSGRAVRQDFPIPPNFLGTPDEKRVNNDIVEVTFELPTQKIPYDYGVQVAAVAPTQVITENEWGMFSMYTIQVNRNDSLAPLEVHGTILLDEGGIVILYVNNTLPAEFMLNTTMGRSDDDIDRYALQWGPLVGPQHMMIENFTVVTANVSIMPVFLQDAPQCYGLKMISLSEMEDEPDEEAWDHVPMYTFNLPNDEDPLVDYTCFQPATNSASESYLLHWLLATASCAVLVSAIMIIFMYKRQRIQKFKNLERRLIQEDEDVDENGDHYFVMRSSVSQSTGEEVLPTFVTDRWELPHRCLKVGQTIGSGAFGQVLKGRVSRTLLDHREIHLQAGGTGNATHATVAIKMLQECSETRYVEDFLKEIQMMKEIGYHRNIVSILGCCTLSEPFCLVVDYVPNGDLQSYLCKIRHSVQQNLSENNGYINQEIEMFSPQDLLSVARQITTGMEYMSQKGFIHRDLAARNILVGDNKTVKIGDFGLTRYIYDDIRKIYVNRRGGKLPLKWMSPEAVFAQTFSSASDVWSFGILLFEIVTLGGTPYPLLSNSQLLQALKQGTIMEKPENCSNEVYEIMKSCWRYEPSARPSFSLLRESFTSMLEESSGRHYFEIKVNEDVAYYRIESDQVDEDDIDLEDVEAMRNQIANMYRKTNPDLPVEQHCCNENVGKPRFDKTVDTDNCVTVPTDSGTYSDQAFQRSQSQSSSFHNELYSSDLDETDTIVIRSPTETSLCVKSTRSSHSISSCQSIPSGGFSEEDHTSGLSDDVFIECSDCKNLSTDAVQGMSDDRQCELCRIDEIRIAGFDGQKMDRTISPSTSVNSVESGIVCGKRYPSSLSNSSNGSNEYLMPESPCLVVYTKIDTDTLDSIQTGSETFRYEFMIDRNGKETYVAAMAKDAIGCVSEPEEFTQCAIRNVPELEVNTGRCDAITCPPESLIEDGLQHDQYMAAIAKENLVYESVSELLAVRRDFEEDVDVVGEADCPPMSSIIASTRL